MKYIFANLILALRAVQLATADAAQPPVVAAAAAAVAAVPEVNEAPVAPEGYLVASHSFYSPFNQDPSLPNWLFTDNIVPSTATNEGLTLSSTVGRSFGLWNKIPLMTDTIEIEATFNLKMPAGSQGAEGLALWLVSENPSILPGPHSGWNLLGYSNQFSGLGVFMSLADRAGKLNPSISAAISDPSRHWDAVKEIPSNDGIYFNFRNGAPFTIKISSKDNSITGQVKTGSGEYKIAFEIKNARIYPGSYLGITGSPNAQSIAPGTQTVTDIFEIQSFQVVNHDGSKNNAIIEAVNRAAEKEELEKLASSDSLANADVGSSVALLTKLLAKHIKESNNRDAELNKMFNSFVSRQDKLSASNERIHSVLQSVKAEPNSELHQELRGLKEEFQKAQTGPNRISADPTVGELAARSASLERTIQQHATFSSYLVGGFGVLVSCLGYFIWRRMKEMEKKHIL